MESKFKIEKWLGVNWRTTLWGYITLVSMVIAANPFSIDFLPDEIEKYVKGFASLIAIISGGATVSNMKDKQVTGGQVPSTHEAAVRIEEDKKDNA